MDRLEEWRIRLNQKATNDLRQVYSNRHAFRARDWSFSVACADQSGFGLWLVEPWVNNSKQPLADS